MSADRCFMVWIKNWAVIYSNTKNSVIFSSVLGSVIFLLNSHLIVLNGDTIFINETEFFACYHSKYINREIYFPIWHMVTLFDLFLFLVRYFYLTYSLKKKDPWIALFNNSVYRFAHFQLIAHLQIVG